MPEGARARGLFVNVAAEGESGFIPGGEVSPFCPFMSFGISFNSWDAIEVDTSAKELTFTAAIDGLYLGVLTSNEAFNSAGGEVSFENTIVSSGNDWTGGYDNTVALFDLVQGELIAGVNASNGQLFDVESGAPLGPVAPAAGYKWGLTFDFDAPVSAQGYDNQGNDAGLSVNPLYTTANDLRLVLNCNNSKANVITLSPNTGDRAFELPQSVGDPYCKIVPPPPPTFCIDFPLIATPFADPSDSTINITGKTCQLITNAGAGLQLALAAFDLSGGGPGGPSLPDFGPTIFQTDDAVVKFEAALDSYDTPNGAYGVFFADQASFDLVAGVQVSPFPSGSFLFDVVNGAPLTATPDASQTGGYLSALYLDAAGNGGAGAAWYKDTEGTFETIGVDPGYNSANKILEAVLMLGSSTATNEITTTSNFGSAPFVLGEDADRWCDHAVPAPVFCSPVNLVIENPPPPNDQIMALTGPNSLTVETTSIGNIVTNAGVGATEFFNTQTEEVKIECTQLTVPLAPVDTINGQPLVLLGFYLDLFGAPQIITGLLLLPRANASAGLTLDAVSGTPVETGFGPVSPIDLAVYLDPTPQQKVFGFSVNSGVAGSVDVHGVVTNITGLELQEDIAANIVANGFTDPTIESMIIDSSDSRNVIITYTLAAGDATVSVTPTNVTIFNQPQLDKPYLLQSARGKARYGGSSVFDYVLTIDPAYNDLLDVYMATAVNAGDNPGSQLNIANNYGSAGFLLGEDALRWCNV